MRILRLKAHAKINLYLNVLNRREEGYHEIQTLMQSVELSDEIRVMPLLSAIEVHCEHPGLANYQKNLAFKAAKLLKDSTGVNYGARIEIEKNIPLGAGLAGGSADAAAVFIALNRLWDTRLSLTELQGFGAKLGSDIPFCLQGGTFLASGRGEKLERITPFPEAAIVIATPEFSLSTAKIYHRWDEIGTTAGAELSDILGSMNSTDLPGICSKLTNSLEEVVFHDYPEVKEIKKRSLQAGALGCIMSGSGPSVFSIAETAKQALAISEELKELCSVVVTNPSRRGIEII